MILLLDIGNSRVHSAVLRDAKLDPVSTAPHSGNQFSQDTYSAWQNSGRPEAVWVANVASAILADNLRKWLYERWGIDPDFVSTARAGFGVVNGYRKPQELGVDRWLNLIAGHRIASGAVCIVDCGSAITIDIVTKAGDHQGGWILPGLAMMTRSLVQGTDAISLVSTFDACRTLDQWARDTREGVANGVLHGAVGGINTAIQKAQGEYGDCLEVIITGGDGSVIAPLLCESVIEEPYLVLKGLAVVAMEAA